jgi:predicted permease
MCDDLRYSLRGLAKHPSFAVAGIVVLGLAVGVNTTVFSLINALLLRPLPVDAPQELGYVYLTKGNPSIAYTWYLELQKKTDTFIGIAARRDDAAKLRLGDDAIAIQGESVSVNYFDVLGLAAPLGRTFLPQDEASGSTPAIIISDAFWRSQFHADSSVIGHVVSLTGPAQRITWYTEGRAYTIIGVAPPDFVGTSGAWQPAQYWVLLRQRALDYPARERDLAKHGVLPIARLAPGVTFSQGRAAVDSAGRDIIQRLSTVRLDQVSFTLVESRRLTLPFAGTYFIDVPRIIATLSAVAIILLIVAASNLAGMLMARGVSRRAEIAIRLSLGVGRFRLVRQLLAESFLLAIGGTLLGMAAARILVASALSGLPKQVPGASGAMLSVDVPLDAKVLAFALGSCVVTAIIAGLAPAIQATRADILSSLALSGGVVAPRQSRSGLRRAVLVPQIALSLVLLLLAGLFVRSALRVETASAGYDPSGVATLSIQLPAFSLDTQAERIAASAKARDIYERILRRIEAEDDVAAAALTLVDHTGSPFFSAPTTIIARRDYQTTNRYHRGMLGIVSAGYFSAMGIPLLRGRTFDARDSVDQPKTAIISAALANDLWPGEDPIGEWFAPHDPGTGGSPRWLEVVGVVGSVTPPLEETARAAYYIAVESQPLSASIIVVRGRGNAAQLIARVKQTIARTEGSAIVAQARPLVETVNALRYPRRFSAAILSASGLAGLLLAALGIFALMSYAVAQRVGEIGVRMVLGAERRDVVRLVLSDGVGVVIAGIVAGFALAFSIIRYASHAIVPLPDADAVTFVVVPIVLVAMVLLACILPARRAARVDPLVVLRNA